LDLGARHIAWCEVVDGVVTRKGSARRLSELEPVLGPATAAARVAFEASREAWHVHDLVGSWGHRPVLLDTTRIRQIGVGQHGRKNDSIDAEAIAMAMDAGRVPVAHVLSPERRVLRSKLSVRSELVEMRARQVTVLRGLARAVGVLIASSTTDKFLEKLEQAPLSEPTRALMAPLVATLAVAQKQLADVDVEIAQIAKADPVIRLCATVPGVAIIVAATFVSVIDDAKRFRNAHAVSAYLGLVPGENTTGGKQRLGSITKQGNAHARAMLVQSACLILRSRWPDDPLWRWATDLAKTRGKKIATVALARKLAGVLWAMWRDGTVYDPAFQARQSAGGLLADTQSQELRAQAMAQVAKKILRRERTPRRGSRATTSRAATM
jgi:transposase